MQILDKRFRYEAKWGPYALRVLWEELAHPGWRLTVSRDDKELVRSFQEKLEDVLQAAGMWLMQKGCAAVVDGAKRPVTDFLVFDVV